MPIVSQVSPTSLAILIFYATSARTHVDGHVLLGSQTQLVHLGNVSGLLHVGSVTSGTKDTGNLGVRVDIVGSDQGTGGVVNQGGHLATDVLRRQEQRRSITQPAKANA
jgi:hypothetical protein